ncbi:MAG: hypothetical protein GY761_06685 [Hyphomicrobiales bacterium]|nr:hypothetical protein [Hyphomicrobiales bacterium]
MKTESLSAGEEGTTLVEVLVAFMIILAFLGVTYQGFVVQLRTYFRTIHLADITHIAERQMALLRSARQVVLGTNSGKDGNYTWQLTVSANPHPPSINSNFRTFDIELNIQHQSWKSNQSGKIWRSTLIRTNAND